ncbi:MAG: beta-hydroxyacyl-ACP dehydratase [Phycisphaerales bacterium]|nr:beta-hydroxyacyl-ACP dehydratase [Phycisphaerales bacterium]
MERPVWLDMLPHRPPFLFVDEVIEFGMDAIQTVFRADPASAWFTGHFPGAPVMPGVLLCECCLQAGAVLMGYRSREIRTRSASEGIPISHAHETPGASRDAVLGATQTAGSTVPVVTRILEAKFKRAVRPGDVLTVVASLDEEMGGAFFMTGKVTVGGETALRCKFAVTQAHLTQLPISERSAS